MTWSDAPTAAEYAAYAADPYAGERPAIRPATLRAALVAILVMWGPVVAVLVWRWL